MNKTHRFTVNGKTYATDEKTFLVLDRSRSVGSLFGAVLSIAMKDGRVVECK